MLYRQTASSSILEGIIERGEWSSYASLLFNVFLAQGSEWPNCLTAGPALNIQHIIGLFYSFVSFLWVFEKGIFYKCVD